MPEPPTDPADASAPTAGETARPATATPSPPGVPGAVLDPSGLQAEDIAFVGDEGTQVNGWLARPIVSPEPMPAMIVIHEAGGLNAHVRDVCLRLANLGYVALGVDLYTREGGPPPTDDMQEVLARLFSIDDARVLGDLEGAAHAFFADYRPTYRPEPAHRLWAELVPFLERHLRAG